MFDLVLGGARHELMAGVINWAINGSLVTVQSRLILGGGSGSNLKAVHVTLDFQI